MAPDLCHANTHDGKWFRKLRAEEFCVFLYGGTKTILNNSVLRPGFGSPGKTLRGCLIPPDVGEGLPGRLQAFLVLCAWLPWQTLSNWQVGSGADPLYFGALLHPDSDPFPLQHTPKFGCTLDVHAWLRSLSLH